MPSLTNRTITRSDSMTLQVSLYSDAAKTTEQNTSTATVSFRVTAADNTALINLTQADSQVTVGQGTSSERIDIELGTADTDIQLGEHDMSLEVTIGAVQKTFAGKLTVQKSLHV